MPAGSKPGERRGGRQRGSKNKKKQIVDNAVKAILGASAAATLDHLIGESERTVQEVLHAKLSCGVCHGTGKTRFQPGGKQHLSERTCQSCYGSGYERLSPSERLRAALELLTYGHSKRSAVEVTNPDGSLRPQWVVVKPGEAAK